MTTSPQVAAVIPTHARRGRLPELLDAVLAEPFAEVLVVVNGGDDGSLALLQARAAEDRRLRPLEVEAAGKPSAVMRGIEEASSEVVLILDDDVLPRPGLAEGHARHHAAGTGRVIVGYMPVSSRLDRRPGEYGTELYSRAYEHVCSEYEADPKTILQGLWGGNVSLRREDALRIDFNGKDPGARRHLRHEDRDFGLRCAQLGLEASFDRSLLAEHRHQVTPQRFLATMRGSGRARWTMHRVHPDALGPLPDDFFFSEVRLPGRPLIRLSRYRPGYRPVRALLGAVTNLTGHLRLFRLETHAAWLLGVVEQQQGAREAESEAGGEAADE
ncbi:MAG TPA: glycosyltransferase family 2 protein [Solirubrobacterales bacterium]|nr:glycosyltransferase family 2 protein [Solirubrobacterales bacterium]